MIGFKFRKDRGDDGPTFGVTDLQLLVAESFRFFNADRLFFHSKMLPDLRAFSLKDSQDLDSFEE